MRFNLPVLRRMSDALRNRDWFGVGFELFVVVLGVVLGMQASRWAQEREDAEYRRQIVASIERAIADYEYEGRRLHDVITRTLDDYARRTATGARPPPPFIVLPGLSERPLAPGKRWSKRGSPAPFILQ